MNLQFIDAGQFKTLLSLQENRPVFDDAGGYQEQWSEIASLWGGLNRRKAAINLSLSRSFRMLPISLPSVIAAI